MVSHGARQSYEHVARGRGEDGEKQAFSGLLRIGKAAFLDFVQLIDPIIRLLRHLPGLPPHDEPLASKTFRGTGITQPLHMR